MAQVVIKDLETNKVLITMWGINNKMAKKEQLNEGEIAYYNKYLGVITSYYISYGDYWKSQSKIE